MKYIPNTVVGLIEELENMYPARCMKAGETLEDHLLYAGRVSLISEMRSRYDAATRSEQGELERVLS